MLEPDKGWRRSQLTDEDSNVFHKALPYDVNGCGKQELIVGLVNSIASYEVTLIQLASIVGRAQDQISAAAL